MEVRRAEIDGVGIWRAQAENCSFAGSRRCGGEICRRVWMTIWTESASSCASSVEGDAVAGAVETGGE